MSRPISGKQLGKLGRRLAQPGPISDEDYEMLARVAEVYQAVLDKVEQRLRLLGYQATTRVKTTGTLVDKLRRTPHLPLGSIHDLAGARIVSDGGRWEQDQVVGRIMAAFGDYPKAPQIIDRREKPSYSYRAVHVIVFEDSTPSRYRSGPSCRTLGRRSQRSSVTCGAADLDRARALTCQTHPRCQAPT
jgi:hypothetical protein